MLDFDIESLDVDTDPALTGPFGDRVPVVAFAGAEIIAAPFQPPALRVAIARALSAGPAQD